MSNRFTMEFYGGHCAIAGRLSQWEQEVVRLIARALDQGTGRNLTTESRINSALPGMQFGGVQFDILR